MSDDRRENFLARQRKQLDAGEVWTETARQTLFKANDEALFALRRVGLFGSFFARFPLRDWIRLVEVDERGQRRVVP